MRREDGSKGVNSKHKITQMSSTPSPWQYIRGTWHTQTYLSRVVHLSSWWDGVLFPLLHVHLITSAYNSSHMADTDI